MAARVIHIGYIAYYLVNWLLLVGNLGSYFSMAVFGFGMLCFYVIGVPLWYRCVGSFLLF